MAELADRISAAVLAHPDVVRLDGGPFGTIATPLPGRRVDGVLVGSGVEVSVVLGDGRPLPEVTAELRAIVHALTGPTAVDIHVSGVESR